MIYNLYVKFSVFLLFLSISFPTAFMNFKKILCIILVFFFFLLHEKIFLKKSIIVWFTIYIISAIFYSFIASLYRGNDLLIMWNTYILNPIITFLALLPIFKKDKLKLINKIFYFSAIFISVYNLIAFFQINGFITFPKELFQYTRPNIGGIDIGFIKITSQNLVSLLYLVPYIITDIILTEEKKIKKSFILYLLLVNVFISFRTMNIFVTLIGLILACLIKRKQMKFRNLNLYKKILKNILIILSIVILCFKFNDKLNIIYLDFIDSFNKESTINSYGVIDSGSIIRYEQMEDLIFTWSKKPIIGWGDGANSINVIRSSVSGFYELTYLAMLMQRGVIGFTIYVGQMLWIIIKLFKVSKVDNENFNIKFGILVGFISLLIANATNPYIASFDGSLILISSLVLINNNYKNEFKEKRIFKDERNYFSRRIRNKIVSSNKGDVKADDCNI